jgi:acyl dehydratase
MNLTLERMPDLGALSLKALGSVRRKPKPEIELPEMSVALAGVTFDAHKLQAYRAICGFPDTGGLPITYPQVHAIGLQMHLLTQPQFPLPLVGLVHLKNRIRQRRELQAGETFDARIAVTASRTTDKGFEFDLETIYTDTDGEAVWTAVATVLHRQKKPGVRKGTPPENDARLSEYHAVDAPADIGRRYGRISGDMNPIHLYPFTAKLLGFERHIAHGMWSLARACALLQGGLGRPPAELDAQFRQPLFLPARAALRHGRDGDAFVFSLIGRDSGKTHLTGSLR